MSDRKFVEVLRSLGLQGVLRSLGLLGLLGVLGLAGCSSEDAEESEGENSFPVEVMGVVTPFEYAVEADSAAGSNRTDGVTRAWLPPSGFELMDPQDQNIGVFLTQDGQVPIQGYFYKGGEDWYTTLKITDAATYYLYGYRPHTSGVTSTISSTDVDNDNSSYSTGAVLKINNLPSVTANDVCVVVGAKNGISDYNPNADYTVTGLRRGSFTYDAHAMGTTSNNYVFLLFDHLYSSLRVRMKVDGDYNALRTIKLKELRLKTSANGITTKKRVNATVTLSATNGSTTPISSVSFTPVGTDDGDGTMYLPPEPIALTTDYCDYTGYFMATSVDKLFLTSIYDVYDKKGTLTRENCKVTNAIDIHLFDRQTEATRGIQYWISLNIQPTYLYVLSDPDLDNPTVVIGNGN